MQQVVELEVSALQPGMAVAAAVVDDAGRVLLPVGAILSDSAIAGLMRREIGKVGILQELALAPEELAALRGRVAGQLDHVFRKAGDGPATRALYEAVLAHRLEGQP